MSLRVSMFLEIKQVSSFEHHWLLKSLRAGETDRRHKAALSTGAQSFALRQMFRPVKALKALLRWQPETQSGAKLFSFPF